MKGVPDVADVKIQIYGIRTVEDARMVIDLGAHHIGVSYGKIKRTPGQLTCEEAKEIFDNVQPHAVKVGLTVAYDIDEITENLKIALPDILHLSGDIEGISPENIQILRDRFPGLKIMQALPVYPDIPLSEQKVLELVKRYEPTTDFWLIDTKVDGTTDIGATGVPHDWSIDRAIIESTSKPCIIAGGLNADNVASAIRATKPYGVDSFSHTNYDHPVPGKGIKDPVKTKAFIEAALNA